MSMKAPNFLKKLPLYFLLYIIYSSINLVHAEDLFNSDIDRSFSGADTISMDATIGGYPIYQGDKIWKILSGKSMLNNINMRLGEAKMLTRINNKPFAEMYIMVNLQQKNSYFVGDLCSKNHLVKVNKGGGKNDNCLTIDFFNGKINGRDTVTFDIKIDNSQTGARKYYLNMYLNLEFLGFKDTTISDWTEEAIANNIEKRKLLEKVTAWAKKLQDGVNKAIDYSKPIDAFSEVPPLGVLLPKEDSIVEAQPIVEIKSNQQLRTPVADNQASKTLLQRLSELKELLDKGLINQLQYDKKSDELIRDF